MFGSFAFFALLMRYQSLRAAKPSSCSVPVVIHFRPASSRADKYCHHRAGKQAARYQELDLPRRCIDFRDRSARFLNGIFPAQPSAARQRTMFKNIPSIARNAMRSLLQLPQHHPIR